jgi:putative transposase
MMKNHKLARAVSDVGWGMLVSFLGYKAAREGKAFVKCDRWFPSTKTCSECGSITETKTLDVRSWTCPHCGAHHDRDINAAKNIRAEGLRILAGGTPATADRGKVSHGKKSNLSAVRLPLKSEAPAFRRG